VGITELICSCCKKEGAQVYKHQIGEGISVDLVMCPECFEKMNAVLNKTRKRRTTYHETGEEKEYKSQRGILPIIPLPKIITKGKIQ